MESAMLDPLTYFALLGIVEAVQGAYQIAGDPSDSFKRFLGALPPPAAGAGGVE